MKKNASKNRKKRKSGGEQYSNANNNSSSDQSSLTNGCHDAESSLDSSESPLKISDSSPSMALPGPQQKLINGILKSPSNSEDPYSVHDSNHANNGTEEFSDQTIRDCSIQKLVNRLDNCLGLLSADKTITGESSVASARGESDSSQQSGHRTPLKESESNGKSSAEAMVSNGLKETQRSPELSSSNSASNQRSDHQITSALDKLKIVSDTIETSEKSGRSSRKIEFCQRAPLPPELMPDDSSSDDPVDDSEANQYYQDLCSQNLERILKSRRERNSQRDKQKMPGTSTASTQPLEDSAACSDESRNSFHTAYDSPSKMTKFTDEETMIVPIERVDTSGVDQLIFDIKKRLKLDSPDETPYEVGIIPYEGENQLPDIMRLVSQSLSEPYTIYTYRYFLHNWPNLCFMAQHKDGTHVGTIVCKLSRNRHLLRRGYIAMLTVDETYKRQKIGSRLVKTALSAMIDKGCDEVVLETEVTNAAALGLYENLGFVKDKRLFRYYLNGVDAFRLKLRLTAPQQDPMMMLQNQLQMFG